MSETEFHITIDSSPASDSWGFVGRVMVESHECYRTLSAYPTPTDAQHAAQVLVGDVLGALLAGHEWRTMSDARGRAVTREDLGLGLRPRMRRSVENEEVT